MKLEAFISFGQTFIKFLLSKKFCLLYSFDKKEWDTYWNSQCNIVESN